MSPSAIEVTALPVTTQITATLVPGARITITVKGSKAVVRRGHRLEFHYTPDRGAPEPVLLLARNSLTALFVAYYLHIMIVAFFSAAAGLAIIVLWPMIHRLIDLPAYRKREKEPDE